MQFRHEYKYLCNESQMVYLESKLKYIMKIDSHARDKGYYKIRSAYFDNYKNSCFYDNENGIDPREKFRIRIYNNCLDRISLELKRKARGKILKQSYCLSRELCMRMLDSKGVMFEESENIVYNKWLIERKINLLKPVIIVEYDRVPYVYKEGNVRITFDRNICSSTNLEGFTHTNLATRAIMPLGYHILEVKYDEFIPDAIYNCLNTGQLQRITFSKYYLCRKYNFSVFSV